MKNLLLVLVAVVGLLLATGTKAHATGVVPVLNPVTGQVEFRLTNGAFLGAAFTPGFVGIGGFGAVFIGARPAVVVGARPAVVVGARPAVVVVGGRRVLIRGGR